MKRRSQRPPARPRNRLPTRLESEEELGREPPDSEADTPREEAVHALAEQHDTLEERDKLAGRRRPPPKRDSLVEDAVSSPALVVGALPAHVEGLFDEDAARHEPTRADVRVARVHPALVAALRSPLVVGDRIRVTTVHGQLWAVQAQARETWLGRPEVEHGRQPQPLVANARELWIVASVAEPPLRPGLVDRFLVAAAAGGLVPRLCATKIDLGADPQALRWLDFYESTGMTVLRTSTHTGEGLEQVRAALEGTFSVLVGQSGVGKSSIVRAILPQQPIAVAEISQATGKGRHTTTVTRYYRLPRGGAVVDTPGLRELGLWGATREHLYEAFPEIAEAAARCRFLDCRHVAEPGCGVREALQLGTLLEDRVASFRKLGAEIDERLRPGYGRPGGPGGR